MRRVNFDYANTCPQIDAAIRDARRVMRSFIDNLLGDACGLLAPKRRAELAEEYTESLYRDLEDVFEKTRSENEKMRWAADDQISNLKDEIERLEMQVAELERHQA